MEGSVKNDVQRESDSQRVAVISAIRTMACLSALLLPLLTGLAACNNAGAFSSTGKWSGTVTNGTLSVPLEVTITDAAGDLSGTGTLLGISMGDFTGTLTGPNGTLTFHPSALPASTIELRGQFAGNAFKGDYVVDGTKTGTFALKR